MQRLGLRFVCYTHKSYQTRSKIVGKTAIKTYLHEFLRFRNTFGAPANCLENSSFLRETLKSLIYSDKGVCDFDFEVAGVIGVPHVLWLSI